MQEVLITTGSANYNRKCKILTNVLSESSLALVKSEDSLSSNRGRQNCGRSREGNETGQLTCEATWMDLKLTSLNLGVPDSTFLSAKTSSSLEIPNGSFGGCRHSNTYTQIYTVTLVLLR